MRCIRGRLVAFALVTLAYLGAPGCEPSSRDVGSGPGVDAGCVAMPTECPATLECELEAATLACAGERCCQSFCQENGCATCCAGAGR
jgi:hypothetical protein